MTVCAFTSLVGEDAHWLPQYLAEAERLRMPFVMHFDRCSRATKDAARGSPFCVGSTEQNNPAIEFTEQHKQRAFDKVADHRFDWAMAWDADEVYERDAPEKLAALEHADADCLDTRWLNLWGDAQHVRVDGKWAEGHRVKLYNLQGGRRWHFDHPITNGAKLVGRVALTAKLDLVCLHHGLKTHELRVQHKERWDRIYSKALRGDPNPYKAWDYALDPSITPIVIRHGY